MDSREDFEIKLRRYIDCYKTIGEKNSIKTLLEY